MAEALEVKLPELSPVLLPIENVRLFPVAQVSGAAMLSVIVMTSHSRAQVVLLKLSEVSATDENTGAVTSTLRSLFETWYEIFPSPSSALKQMYFPLFVSVLIIKFTPVVNPFGYVSVPSHILSVENQYVLVAIPEPSINTAFIVSLLVGPAATLLIITIVGPASSTLVMTTVILSSRVELSVLFVERILTLYVLFVSASTGFSKSGEKPNKRLVPEIEKRALSASPDPQTGTRA